MARVAEHGLEVVDHAAAGAHAAGGNHHGRLAAVGKMLDHAAMILMAVNGDELLEGQRVAAGLQPLLGLGIPVPAQASVAGGEVAGER